VEARPASSLVQQVEARWGCFPVTLFCRVVSLVSSCLTSSATIRPWPLSGYSNQLQFLRQPGRGVKPLFVHLPYSHHLETQLVQGCLSQVFLPWLRYPPSALRGGNTFWTGLGSAARVGLLLCSFYFGFRFCYTGAPTGAASPAGTRMVAT